MMVEPVSCCELYCFNSSRSVRGTQSDKVPLQNIQYDPMLFFLDIYISGTPFLAFVFNCLYREVYLSTGLGEVTWYLIPLVPLTSHV